MTRYRPLPRLAARAFDLADITNAVGMVHAKLVKAGLRALPLPPPPNPSRCFAISGLAGFCDLISGLQRVRGKILRPNKLADRECNLLVSYEASM
jgi:hypothetical protein